MLSVPQRRSTNTELKRRSKARREVSAEIFSYVRTASRSTGETHSRDACVGCLLDKKYFSHDGIRRIKFQSTVERVVMITDMSRPTKRDLRKSTLAKDFNSRAERISPDSNQKPQRLFAQFPSMTSAPL